MALTPPSSIPPASVTVSGTVAVTGPLTLAELEGAGLATEATLADAADSLDDVGLTAILQRERMDVE